MSTYKSPIATEKEIKDVLMNDPKIWFVVWNFNSNYTHALEKLNREFLEEKGFDIIQSYFVPGAFEIPWFTKKLIESGKFDLIIALWVVIKGETPHFDYVCWESSRWIMDLNIKYNIPIIFGVLTCNNISQVEERMNNWFAISAINLLVELNKLNKNLTNNN